MANLLIIDDSRFTGRFLKRALECEGHQVSWLMDENDVSVRRGSNGIDLLLINQTCGQGSGWCIFNDLKQDNRDFPAMLYFLEECKLTRVTWVIKAVNEALYCLQEKTPPTLRRSSADASQIAQKLSLLPRASKLAQSAPILRTGTA